jgi:predicted PurR-regulated permease PerM
LIPYFGPWLSGILAALLTALSGQVITALIVVVAYIVIQQVEGHVLIPYVMMRVVEVNPLTVVIATLLGFALLGVIGAVLAVPTASIIHVLVVRLTAPMIRKHTQRAEESADAGEDEDVSEDEMTHTAQQADHRE